MPDIPQHRQQLIEEIALFEGVFEELATLNVALAKLSRDELPEIGFQYIFEIIRGRYAGLSEKLMTELRDNQPLAEPGKPGCHIVIDATPEKANGSPESPENKASAPFRPRNPIAHNV